MLTLLVGPACATQKCDTSGFTQLTSRAPRTVGFPGQDLGAVGAFEPLRVLGRDGRATAVAGVGEGDQVEIHSMASADVCSVNSDLYDAPAAEHVLMAVEDLLVLGESMDETGRGRLHLVDDGCSEVARGTGAVVVPRSDRLIPLRVLLHDESGDLVAIDVADRSSSVVDEGVSTAVINRTNLVEIVESRLVVRDVALREIRRIGSDVTELLTVGEGSQIAFVDGGSLYYLASPEDEPSQVDDGVCSVRLADAPTRKGAGGWRYLSYFAPCEQSTLTVADLSGDRRFTVGTATSTVAAARPVEVGGDPRIAVFHAPSGSASPNGPDALWVAVEGAEPIELGIGSVETVGRVSAGTIVLWLGQETTESRLVRWSPEGEIEELARDVIAFETETYPERALVRTEGDSSELIAVEGVTEPTVIAEQAPDVGDGTQYGSVFGNLAEGDVGQLRLVMAESGLVEDVAERVHLPTAGVYYDAEAAIYLDQFDAALGIGRLCVRSTDTADTFCESDVATFLSTVRPERGLAYIKIRRGGQHLLFTTIE